MKPIWVTVTVILILLVIAASAFGLALAAFLDGQSSNAHADLKRRNVYVASDLCVEGESRLEGTVFANSNLYVEETVEAAAAKVNRFAWKSFYVIKATGTIDLTTALGLSSSIRIDTPGGGITTLVLPLAASFPGQIVQIAISQAGAASTVNLAVSSGNIFVTRTGSTTTVNPVATYPRNAGEPDVVWLTNDGVSVWSTV